MKHSKMETVAATNDLATVLGALVTKIPTPALSKAERKRLYSNNEVVPDALIEMMAHQAEQSGGHVLGIPFDAAQARATLAKVVATRTALALAKQLVQRLEDDLVQERITIADPTFALYTALRRLTNTKAGNAFKPAYEQMRAIVKNRPRKTRKATGAKAGAKPAQPGTAAAEAPGGAAVNAPAHGVGAGAKA